MVLFNKYNEIEQKLLKLYSQIFTKMGMPDVQEAAKNILNQAIEESKKKGSYYLPSNFGDILLGKQKAEDPAVEKMVDIMRKKDLPKKRAEGVRDEDIRWWWDLNDIERRMMIKMDDWAKLTVYKYNKPRIGKNRAIEKVHKAFPVYGNPSDTTNTEGDDRPLPYELKKRIDIYIEKSKNNPEKFKKGIESLSSFNAFVRKEIKAGNL